MPDRERFVPFCCSSFRGRLIKDHSGKRTLFLSPGLGFYLGVGLVWPCWRPGKGKPQGHVWNACLDQFSMTATHIALNLIADRNSLSRSSQGSTSQLSLTELKSRCCRVTFLGDWGNLFQLLQALLHPLGPGLLPSPPRSGWIPPHAVTTPVLTFLPLPLIRTLRITRGPSGPPGKTSLSLKGRLATLTPI